MPWPIKGICNWEGHSLLPLVHVVLSDHLELVASSRQAFLPNPRSLLQWKMMIAHAGVGG